MELGFESASSPCPSVKATHVSDKGLDKFMRMSHIGENQSKVVLRCSQQVRAEHDGERFCCHVVLLLKVGHSGRNGK